MFFSIYTSMLRFCLLPQLRGCALSLSICIRRILYIYIILRPSLSFMLHLGWIDLCAPACYRLGMSVLFCDLVQCDHSSVLWFLFFGVSWGSVRVWCVQLLLHPLPVSAMACSFLYMILGIFCIFQFCVWRVGYSRAVCHTGQLHFLHVFCVVRPSKLRGCRFMGCDSCCQFCFRHLALAFSTALGLHIFGCWWVALIVGCPWTQVCDFASVSLFIAV